MNIEFDSTKDVSNIQKHGVSLALAESLEWDWLISRQDGRKDYGEPRQIGFAPIGSRVFCVVFVQRGDSLRIISLRKANSREVKSYASALEDQGI
jgi:uncharacterized protein